MDAKHIAQLNNQNYLAAYHAVNAARMRYYQALGAYAPEIHLGSTVGQDMQWNSSRVNPPMTNAAGRDISFKVNSSVTASWLLFDGFARYLNVKAMQSEVRKQTAMQYKVLCMPITISRWRRKSNGSRGKISSSRTGFIKWSNLNGNRANARRTKC